MVVYGLGDLGRFTKFSTMGGGTALDRVNKTKRLNKVLSSINIDIFSVQITTFSLGLI